MVIDLKTILLLLTGLIIPCFGWVWRISTNQKILQNRFDAMQADYAKKTNVLTGKIAEMPTHKTIHNMEKTLIKIDGRLGIITTELNNMKENHRTFEEALVRMDNRIQEKDLTMGKGGNR